MSAKQNTLYPLGETPVKSCCDPLFSTLSDKTPKPFVLRNFFTRLRRQGLWALGFLLACFAMSESYSKGLDSQQPKGSPIVWYDGPREQSVWMSGHEVVEFSRASTAQPGKALKALAPQAKLKKVIGGARIWSIEVAAVPTLKSLSASSNGGNYSPVFHRGFSLNGPRMALPGNIIVTFKPDWSREQIDAWAGLRQLQVLQQLPTGANIFVIKTDAGMTGLELANELYRSGEVLSATPNWWREVFTR